MKKPELLIHIGYPKTGSTALQESFVKNRRYLLSKGIYYGDCYNYQHYNLYMELIFDLLNNFFKIKDAKKQRVTSSILYNYREPSENIINRMLKNFKKYKCNKLIISSESLSYIFTYYGYYYILNNNGIIENNKNNYMQYVNKKIKNIFIDFNIKFIIYIRRQDLFLESFFNQLLKLGSSYSYYNFFNNYSDNGKNKNILLYENNNDIFYKYILFNLNCEWLDYYNLAVNLAYSYGKENIIFKVYEKNQLPDIISDFYPGMLNIEKNDKNLIKASENDAVNLKLHRDLIEYKLYCLKKGIKLDNFWKYMELSKDLDVSRDYQNYFSTEFRKKILDIYSESNEKLAKEYLSREDGILFYEPVNNTIYPGFNEEMFKEISKKLNKKKYKKNNYLIKNIVYYINGIIPNNFNVFIKYLMDFILAYIKKNKKN